MPSVRSRIRLALVILLSASGLGLGLGACERSRERPDASVADGGADGTGQDVAGGARIPNVAEPFIALAGDFAGFRDWYSLEVAHSEDPIVGAHGGGPR